MFDPNYNALLGYWHTASWAFILAALAVFIYGQYKRRSPHPVCRKCGYDLASLIRPDPQQTTKLPTPPPTCPECGHASKKYFFKRPIKRRVVGLAVVLFGVAQLLCIIPRAQRIGPVGFIPTWVLAVCAPHPQAVRFFDKRLFSDHISDQDYESMFAQLDDRIRHGDHNWLHTKLITFRNNSKWFKDIVDGRLMLAYPIHGPITGVNASQLLGELEEQVMLRFMCINYLHKEFAWTSTKTDFVFADPETHEKIQKLRNECLKPFDDKFTNVYIDMEVPANLVALETTRYADYASLDDGKITMDKLSEIIHHVTGMWVDTSSLKCPISGQEASENPHLFSNGTLSEILDEMTMHHNCNNNSWMKWYVVGDQLLICSDDDAPMFDAAYDFRLSKSRPPHNARAHEVNGSTTMYQEVTHKLLSQGYHDDKGDYRCTRIHNRYLVHAPLHIHARIQRLLPILRAELTLADKSQNP